MVLGPLTGTMILFFWFSQILMSYSSRSRNPFPVHSQVAKSLYQGFKKKQASKYKQIKVGCLVVHNVTKKISPVVWELNETTQYMFATSYETYSVY